MSDNDKESRRRELIDKALSEGLSDDEIAELRQLKREIMEWLRKTAPLRMPRDFQ